MEVSNIEEQPAYNVEKLRELRNNEHSVAE